MVGGLNKWLGVTLRDKTDALKIAGKGSKCMEDMIAKAKKQDILL